jgi:glycine/D-amino acid oxidase-like deaminating enzyme
MHFLMHVLGFKMGPVLGEMIADTAEGKAHRWSSRYAWRDLSEATTHEEEARFLG